MEETSDVSEGPIASTLNVVAGDTFET